jgi:excisionase family DNA binding protein
MKHLSFEELPKAISQLSEQLDRIENSFLSNDRHNQNSVDEILTLKQAAEFVFLKPPKIYELVRKREIPVCKKGKRLYFLKEDLIAWIKKGRIKTNAEISAENDAFLSKNRRAE